MKKCTLILVLYLNVNNINSRDYYIIVHIFNENLFIFLSIKINRGMLTLSWENGGLFG
jgi:predicted nuclease of restriction endonuclease-like (RecB) superfamily